MTSLNEMVRRCEGLIGTKYVTAWESTFLASIARQTCSGKDTSRLTGNQVETLQQIHTSHFS